MPAESFPFVTQPSRHGGLSRHYKYVREQQVENCNDTSSTLFLLRADFTSWSSTREPAQVFVLLQTIYQAFDVIAKRHKVFKVETIGTCRLHSEVFSHTGLPNIIGDCHVAVTGLPNPQARHAVLMARFAWECLQKMGRLTKKLETMLGPDTADLGIRIGYVLPQQNCTMCLEPLTQRS